MDCGSTMYAHRNNILMTKSLEKILEDAHLCGELKLGGWKLKEFPVAYKYDLSDTTIADLSENCFNHFPVEIIKFWSLESLNLHHNSIRSIPNTITSLQSLVNLDLSRNCLTCLPSAMCQLPLEILLLSNNKLKQLPAEIGFCKTLIELDVSCNMLTNLPSQVGQLCSLKCLNLQNNRLIEIPLELTYLNLAKLNVSMNQIASLPVELRLMSSLESLNVNNNPLISPPTIICVKGRNHIFKWLEIKSIKDGRNRGSSWKFSSIKSNNHSLDSNMDSLGLSETTSLAHSSDEGTQESLEYFNKSDKKSCENNGYNSSEIIHTSKSNGHISTNLNKYTNNNNNCIKTNDQPKHTQSYREYKEFLKKQRTQESIYKGKIQNNDNNFDQKDIRPYIKPEIISTSNLSLPSASSNIWSTNIPNKIPKNKLQFTMKREFDKQKEEAEFIEQLRNTIESRLKMSLPSDLSPALSDGVVLCYLANHVKPRSVASIHVPSPAVPRLTMARCRRNVDNFLEACRKIGISENLICCAVDILEGKNIVNLAITVAELLKFHSPKSPSQIIPPLNV